MDFKPGSEGLFIVADFAYEAGFKRMVFLGLKALIRPLPKPTPYFSAFDFKPRSEGIRLPWSLKRRSNCYIDCILRAALDFKQHTGEKCFDSR